MTLITCNVGYQQGYHNMKNKETKLSAVRVADDHMSFQGMADDRISSQGMVDDHMSPYLHLTNLFEKGNN